MTFVRASAPGKVVVCGEYAVLDGATAIVMAIDRRACVRVSRLNEEWHRVTAPGFEDGPFDFHIDPRGRVQPRESAGTVPDWSLLSSVWQAVQPAFSGSLRLDLDTRPFFHARSGEKLGLGSSAALVAALAAAFLHLAADARDPGPLAYSAHRILQGGHGSGIDVAAALQGGVIAYKKTPQVAASPLVWPDRLHRAVLWSGRSASTATRVASLGRSVRSRRARNAASRLAHASEDVVNTWNEGETRAILDALRAYTGDLKAFSVAHDLGIFDAGHDELHGLAAEGHLVYKPCGAGGGDVGMALADRESVLEHFVDRACRRGFERLDVNLETSGVEVSPGEVR